MFLKDHVHILPAEYCPIELLHTFVALVDQNCCSFLHQSHSSKFLPHSTIHISESTVQLMFLSLGRTSGISHLQVVGGESTYFKKLLLWLAASTTVTTAAPGRWTPGSSSSSFHLGLEPAAIELQIVSRSSIAGGVTCYIIHTSSL